MRYQSECSKEQGCVFTICSACLTVLMFDVKLTFFGRGGGGGGGGDTRVRIMYVERYFPKNSKFTIFSTLLFGMYRCSALLYRKKLLTFMYVLKNVGSIVPSLFVKWIEEEAEWNKLSKWREYTMMRNKWKWKRTLPSISCCDYYYYSSLLPTITKETLKNFIVLWCLVLTLKSWQCLSRGRKSHKAVL